MATRPIVASLHPRMVVFRNQLNDDATAAVTARQPIRQRNRSSARPNIHRVRHLRYGRDLPDRLPDGSCELLKLAEGRRIPPGARCFHVGVSLPPIADVMNE